MSEKKQEIFVKLENITSEIDEDSYLSFNCDVFFENLYDDEFICEYQLSFYNNNGNKNINKWDHIHFGRLERCIVNSSENNIYCGDTITIDGAYVPNEFKLSYRLSKRIGEIEFSPKLPQKKNTSVINGPSKGLLGGNKWGSKSVEINSLIIKNDNDGQFNYKFTANTSKLDQRGIIFEFRTSDNMVVGDPIIFKNEFVTQTSNIEASEKVDVCCKIFQPMKWIEHVDTTFSTEKISDE